LGVLGIDLFGGGPPSPPYLAGMGTDPSTTPDDGLIIQSLLQALGTFLNTRGSFPLRELVIFLHIALDEGHEAIEYADRLKLHRAQMSKYVHDLADRHRGGGPGLGLIEFRRTDRNLNNRRQIFLTKKGRVVAAAMLKSLRNPYAPLAKPRQVADRLPKPYTQMRI
jgi:DNA-binding MarR family transcriptional regulator